MNVELRIFNGNPGKFSAALYGVIDPLHPLMDDHLTRLLVSLMIIPFHLWKYLKTIPAT